MSSISGLGTTLTNLLASTTNAGATPAQQAETIAEAEQATLGTALVAALSQPDPSDPNDASDLFGPAYDLSPGLFDTAAGALDSPDPLGLAAQLGSLTAPPQWQQVQTPDMTTPGESQSVDPADQLSYLQTTAPAHGAAPGTPSLGTIGTNAGRLVLLGALAGDPEDVQTYSFTLQEGGQLHLAAPDPNSDDPTASLGAVHLQLYDSDGTLVADSDPGAGDAYAAWQQLDQAGGDGAEMAGGSYTIRLSYAEDAPADAKGDFSLFITSGSDPGRVTFYTDATGDAPAPPAPTPEPLASLPSLDLLA